MFSREVSSRPPLRERLFSVIILTFFALHYPLY